MEYIEHVDTIVLLGGLLVFVYNKIRNKKKPQTVESGVALNEKIYPLLWRLTMDYRAVRATIIQFHNGDFFYTGQSIQRNTMTHEVCYTGIPPIKAQMDNQLISNLMHAILKNLYPHGRWGFDDPETADLNSEMAMDELNSMCSLQKIKSAHYFRITDKNDRTVGILCLHWNFKMPLDSMAMEEIMTRVRLIENHFEDAR